MESQDAEHAVPHAQDSATGAGRTRLQPQLNFSSWIKFLRAKARRTLWMRGAAVWGPGWGIGGVDSVHTLGLGLGRTGAGLGRIPYVSAGGPCLQGLEPGSSPTSGTCFPFRGWWASECAQSVHCWAPSGAFLFPGRCCGRGSHFFPEGGRLSFGPVHGPRWLGQHDLNNPGSNSFVLDAGCSPASSSAFCVCSASSWWVRGRAR